METEPRTVTWKQVVGHMRSLGYQGPGTSLPEVQTWLEAQGLDTQAVDIGRDTVPLEPVFDGRGEDIVLWETDRFELAVNKAVQAQLDEFKRTLGGPHWRDNKQKQFTASDARELLGLGGTG